MQAVPSLVGTGTVVAAAANGLVIAQAMDEPGLQQPSSSRPRPTSGVDNTLAGPLITSRPPAKSVSYVSPHNLGAAERLYNDRNSSNHGGPSSSRQQAVAPEPGNVPSTMATLPRSTTASYPPLSSRNRRHSFIQKGEWMPPPVSDVSRDSISSNGSWIRRLSIRPLSQHGSPRSSVGPDSLNFSLGSAAPILSPSTSTPPQPQPRNKLVKRTTTAQDVNITSLVRRGSRSQMPTLRRPATSHQRSATLQQIPQPDDVAFSPSSVAARPKFSFEQRTRPSLAVFRAGAETPEPADQGEQGDVGASREEPREEPQEEDPQYTIQNEKSAFYTRWTSFFHERVMRTSATVRGGSPLSNENSPGGPSHQPYPLPSRTIQVQRGKQSRVCLTQAAALATPQPGSAAVASAISSSSPVVDRSIRRTVGGEGEEIASSPQDLNSSPQDTPSKRARRSISMHFSSPTNWISRTGSIRRPKRGSEYLPGTGVSGSTQASSQPIAPSSTRNGTRHVSAPLPATQPSTSQKQMQSQPRSATTPADMHLRKAVEGLFNQPVPSTKPEPGHSRSSPIPPAYADPRIVSTRQRNSSSPLPPLSRLSSFNVDLSRLGASSSSSTEVVAAAAAAAQNENQLRRSAGFSTLPRSFPLVPQNRDILNETLPILAGADLEMRGFVSSGDDDDTDFKSDTVFDSVRTAASARVRTADTPIESMFDESPPSTASNTKTKRLSIQEILGQAWDSDTRIMEEDEGFSTPIRSAAAKPVRPVSPSSVVHNYEDADYFDTAAQRSRDVAIGGSEANSVLASTEADTDADADFSLAGRTGFSRPSMDDNDDDDDWAHMDENGVTNHLSPPSRSLSNSLRGMDNLLYNSSSDTGISHHNPYHRSALAMISGNGSLDTVQQHDGPVGGERERPRSNLFDWSESTVHLDKIDAEGHSPRPKTVHGKQELDLRNGRPPNRKGPVVAHVRSQSVPVIADPAEGSKPTTSKFGTWASSGPKNASEDWDDDFDFGTTCSDDNIGDDLDGLHSVDEADGQPSTVRSGKGSSAPFAMVVPASIQATQPTVKAHSGQIRELSLLVNGLKRLCRHARDLDIVDESPALWREAENIIALASPDEESPETAEPQMGPKDGNPSQRVSAESQSAGADNCFVDDGFDTGTLNSFEDEPFNASDAVSALANTPPPPEISRTPVIRERHSVRRRSVFSPEDDIFGGGWPLADERPPPRAEEHQQQQQQQQRPQTPDRYTTNAETPDSAMIESIMEAMQQQRSSSAPIRRSPVKQTATFELFFNTNTLQELVKRANSLFHTLSDLVRRAELITQSPAVTPRHDRLNRREDGSPAFTRVFTDPSSPSRRLPTSHSSNSVLTRASPSLESPSSNRISQRLQMMTVN